ncbi:MAG: hypothetical protein WC994_02750 [Brumimicrobium sp.]
MKILIISYYAFPLNAVASYRIDSFCEGFTKQGAEINSENVDLQKMGSKAYEKVKKRYTFSGNKAKYIDFIKLND